MGYAGIGPATEPEPVPLSPMGQEQVDYRDAEIAKLRAELVQQVHETKRLLAEADGWRRAALAAEARVNAAYSALTGAEGGDSGD